MNKEKKLIFRVAGDEAIQFKAICSLAGVTQQQVFQQLLREYIAKNWEKAQNATRLFHKEKEK